MITRTTGTHPTQGTNPLNNSLTQSQPQAEHASENRPREGWFRGWCRWVRSFFEQGLHVPYHEVAPLPPIVRMGPIDCFTPEQLAEIDEINAEADRIEANRTRIETSLSDYLTMAQRTGRESRNPGVARRLREDPRLQQASQVVSALYWTPAAPPRAPVHLTPESGSYEPKCDTQLQAFGKLTISVPYAVIRTELRASGLTTDQFPHNYAIGVYREVPDEDDVALLESLGIDYMKFEDGSLLFFCPFELEDAASAEQTITLLGLKPKSDDQLMLMSHDYIESAHSDQLVSQGVFISHGGMLVLKELD